MMTSRRFRSIALFLLLFSTVVGCNKPKDEPSKVNILVPAPLTGEAASYGKIVKEGIDIALEELKDDPVKQRLNIVLQDSKLSPKEAVNIFQQEKSLHPISVVMPVSTGEAMALKGLCNENKVVMLPPLADGDELTSARPYFFRVSPASSFQGKVLAESIKGSGITKVAVLYVNEAWGRGLADKFKKYFEGMNGNVVAMESCNPAQTNVRTQIQKIIVAKPDALLILLRPIEMIPALKQIRELGVTAKLYGGDTFSNKAIYTEASDLAQGVIFALPAQPSNEVFAKFNTLYKAKYGVDADVNAAAARDAVMIVAEAVKKDAITGEEIKKFLDSQKEGINGATGLIKWDNNGDVVSKKYELFVVKGKGYVPVGK